MHNINDQRRRVFTKKLAVHQNNSQPLLFTLNIIQLRPKLIGQYWLVYPQIWQGNSSADQMLDLGNNAQEEANPQTGPRCSLHHSLQP